MNRTGGPVVLVVSDDALDRAACYAAQEAGLRGCALQVVRTVPVGAGAGERTRARDVLADAVARGHAVAARSTEVTGTVIEGPPVAAALRASSGARLVVVGHRDVLRLVQALTDPDTSHTVTTPVVCVPAAWSPAAPRPDRVTVAIRHPGNDAELIGTALEIAREHGCTLRILHAWSLPGRSGEQVASRLAASWAEDAGRTIGAELDRLGGGTVPVEIDVRRGAAAPAVLAASRDSALLVLGRHRPGTPAGGHLGGAARAALYGAACPVLLVPPPRPRQGRAPVRADGPEIQGLRRYPGSAHRSTLNA